MVRAISPGTRAFKQKQYEQKVLSPYFVLSKINMYWSKPNIPEKKKNIYHKKTRNLRSKKKLLSMGTKGHDWNSPYKAQAEGVPQEAQPHQRERNSVLSAKHNNRPSADLFFWSTMDK